MKRGYSLTQNTKVDTMNVVNMRVVSKVKMNRIIRKLENEVLQKVTNKHDIETYAESISQQTDVCQVTIKDNK
jgi:hypothetical protein